MNERPRLVVCAAALALLLPFLGKAYHVDEPFYLAAARQAAHSPLHPLSTTLNWYGRELPLAEVQNTPPIFTYLLAAVIAVTGEHEAATRFLLLPIDLAAALALYALATRFSKAPLLPALAALTSPGFVIATSLVYPEKLAFALGAWGLWLVVSGLDDKKARRLYAGAALIGLAALTKYYAAVLIAPGAGYALWRGYSRKRAYLWAAAALAIPTLYLILEKLLSGQAVGAAWAVTEQSAAMPWWSVSHKARSLLAFAGGLTPAAVLVSACAFAPSRRRVFLAVAAAALFLPVFDLAPVVRGVDRVTGALLAAGAVWAMDGLLSELSLSGAALWAPWVVGAGAGLFGLYWSIPARLVWFLAAPLAMGVFCAAERLARPSRRALWMAVAGQAVLTWALADVDYAYAGAQREFAAEAFARAPEAGRVWSAGHWGLQYYVERGGGRELDSAKGGWDALRRGDLVVVPRVNTNVLRPRRPVAAETAVALVSHRLPLRLISGYTGEGGFYTNSMGFLPWSISDEPLDELSLVLIK